MSDHPQAAPAMHAGATLDDHARRAETFLTILAANKFALFAELADVSITTAVVVFDGAGEARSIDLVQTRSRWRPAELPPIQLDIHVMARLDVQTTITAMTLRQALEAITAAILDETHPGWIGAVGASGNITFDVEADRIYLAYITGDDTPDSRQTEF